MVQVHKPLAAAEEFYKKSGAGLYGDTVAEMDVCAGRVLDKLKALDLERNTLVLFVSDNGPWYGGSTGGLRGMKGTSWEGGLRVPCIARWPGKIPAGREVRDPASVVDFFPTIAGRAGLAAPGVDGKDLWPILNSDAKLGREAVFANRGDRLGIVRSGKWKLHLVAPSGARQEKVWKPDEPWTDPRAPDGVRILAPYEQAHPSRYPGVLTGDAVTGVALFDLEADRAEQKNVADANPEVVARLKALAENVLKR
jgi:uncharacterized sulfatase